MVPLVDFQFLILLRELLDTAAGATVFYTTEVTEGPFGPFGFYPSPFPGGNYGAGSGNTILSQVVTTVLVPETPTTLLFGASSLPRVQRGQKTEAYGPFKCLQLQLLGDRM